MRGPPSARNYFAELPNLRARLIDGVAGLVVWQRPVRIAWQSCVQPLSDE